MTARIRSISASPEWDAAPFAFAPRRVARYRLRQFLAGLRGARRGRPLGSGGPPEPAPDVSDNCWDDPALWMLMIH